MNKKEKTIAIVAIIFAAILLLFFIRRNDAVAGSTVIQVPGSNGLPIDFEVPTMEGIITDPNTYNFSGQGYVPSNNDLTYIATYGRNTGNYPPLRAPIVSAVDTGGSNSASSTGGPNGGCPGDNYAPANQYAINAALGQTMTPSLWINSVQQANNAIINGRFTRGW